MPEESPQTTVRPATPDDVPALAALAALTFPLACPPDLPADAMDAFVRDHLTQPHFDGYLRHPGYTVLVAESGPGAPLDGYALLVDGPEMDPEAAQNLTCSPVVGISKFYVHPRAQGRGTARTLHEAVRAQARAAGAAGLWLATNEGNERARAFYTRSGYRVVGTRTFDVGGIVNRDVVMELVLSG